MRSFILAACAVTASAVGATLVLMTSPAVAGSPLCPSNVPAYGTVTGTAPYGRVDYWYNDSPGGTRTFRLYSQSGDFTLYVFDSSCSTQLCSRNAGGTTTAVCSTDYAGTVQIGVHGSYGTIDYTLEAPLPGGTLSTLPPVPIDPPVTVVPSTGYPSDDCATGTTLADGFAGGSYVRVRSAAPSANETWICVRAEGASLTASGKFVITGAGATLPALPVTDNAVGACASAPGNTVPGPHPALAGQLGDPSDPSTYVPFLLDSWAGSGDAWVCVGAGTVNVRAKVSTGASTTNPTVTFHRDLPGSHVQQPPAPSTPSGSCQAAITGVTKYADVTSAGVRTFLYTWQASPTVFKICLRTQGIANVGGVFTIDTTNVNGAVPTVTPGSNPAACGLVVARIASPMLVEVMRSAAGVPLSGCVTVGTTTIAVTATSGSGQQPANVTWTPDPGTP